MLHPPTTPVETSVSKNSAFRSKDLSSFWGAWLDHRIIEIAFDERRRRLHVRLEAHDDELVVVPPRLVGQRRAKMSWKFGVSKKVVRRRRSAQASSTSPEPATARQRRMIVFLLRARLAGGRHPMSSRGDITPWP